LPLPLPERELGAEEFWAEIVLAEGERDLGSACWGTLVGSGDGSSGAGTPTPAAVRAIPKATDGVCCARSRLAAAPVDPLVPA